MHGLQSSCYTGAWIPAGVHDVLVIMVFGLVEEGLDAGLSERPSTGIEWLFLAPNNGFGIRVHIEVLLKLLPWEGIQLLNTRDGRILDALLAAVFMQCSVYLAAA